MHIERAIMNHLTLLEICEELVFFESSHRKYGSRKFVDVKGKATVLRTKVMDYGATIGTTPLHLDDFNAILSAAMAQKDDAGMQRFVQWWVEGTYRTHLKKSVVLKIKPRAWLMLRAAGDNCPDLFYRISDAATDGSLTWT
jgi:hypothetical protein